MGAFCKTLFAGRPGVNSCAGLRVDASTAVAILSERKLAKHLLRILHRRSVVRTQRIPNANKWMHVALTVLFDLSLLKRLRQRSAWWPHDATAKIHQDAAFTAIIYCLLLLITFIIYYHGYCYCEQLKERAEGCVRRVDQSPGRAFVRSQ